MEGRGGRREREPPRHHILRLCCMAISVAAVTHTPAKDDGFLPPLSATPPPRHKPAPPPRPFTPAEQAPQLQAPSVAQRFTLKIWTKTSSPFRTEQHYLDGREGKKKHTRTHACTAHTHHGTKLCSFWGGRWDKWKTPLNSARCRCFYSSGSKSATGLSPHFCQSLGRCCWLSDKAINRLLIPNAVGVGQHVGRLLQKHIIQTVLEKKKMHRPLQLAKWTLRSCYSRCIWRTSTSLLKATCHECKFCIFFCWMFGTERIATVFPL